MSVSTLWQVLHYYNGIMNLKVSSSKESKMELKIISS